MLPFGSTWTRITSPHLPPFIVFGSAGQPSTRRYGLGRAVGLGYGVCCAPAASAKTVTAASAAIMKNLIRGFMDQHFIVESPQCKNENHTAMSGGSSGNHPGASNM